MGRFKSIEKVDPKSGCDRKLVYEDKIYWVKKDRIHRLDGPAIVYADERQPAFFLDGERLTKNEFYSATANRRLKKLYI